MAHLVGLFIGLAGAVFAVLGYLDHDITALAGGLVACLVGVGLLTTGES